MTAPRSVAGAIASARTALRAAGVRADEAPGDAEVLARHALGWDLTQFTLERNGPAPSGFEEIYAALIARRARREPVSQIVGYREFWGLEFEVTRDVLTPRPETELIVHAALDLAPRDRPLVIVDVGTGSGCLAVTLAKEFFNAAVVASDVSAPALEVARRNAKRHGVDKRVAFRNGEFVAQIDVELIVSNPPYVPVRDAHALSPEVRDYEPHVALFAGEDGLDFFRSTFFREAHSALRNDEPSWLIVEVGYDQAQKVVELARHENFELVRTYRDLQDIERVVVLRPVRKE